MKQIIIELLKILVTVIVTLLIERFLSYLKSFLRKHWISRQQKLYNSQKVLDYVNEYYNQNGHYDELYHSEIAGYERTIPFLSHKGWHGLSVDIYRTPDIIQTIDGDALPYKINRHIIRKRKTMGQRLTNEKVLYFSEAKDPLHFVAKECDFFQKISLVGKMEEETFHAVFPAIRETLLRNKLIPDFFTAIKRKPYPVSFGCDVALIICIDGKERVALQKRSLETSSYGGYMAVLPSFGLCPLPDGANPEMVYKSTLYNNPFFYNIIKEYCEEIFNKKELEHTPGGHANPYWFYEKMKEARELINALDEGRASCTYLGFGFDTINGMANLAAMLYIPDETLSMKIYKNSISNWESRSAVQQNGIQFVETDFTILQDYLKNNEYQCESAFTLSLALAELEKLKKSSPST